MRLSISNIAWNTQRNDETYCLMKKYGFTGLEIAPTKIIAERPYEHIEEAVEWKRELKQRYGFCVPSMQSIWFGKTESIFGTKAEKQYLVEYTKRAINYAEAIECKNLVFGCPRNRNMPDNATMDEAKIFFCEIAEYAKEHHTVIGMEANPSIYNTNFMNDTKTTLDFVENIHSDGFLLNLDTGTMIHNQESVELLSGRVQYINHVHVSEPYLALIKKRKLHEELADMLKKAGYKKYISIEMGLQENIRDLEETMQYVKGVFGNE